ncbi:MAG: ThuA domain-containing protein [Puniceicoccales bacterium]|jgi:type 1 glutamine amidotransferase|nr:ThuA domain-containing protein [Puniceicoccales bacterium]
MRKHILFLAPLLAFFLGTLGIRGDQVASKPVSQEPAPFKVLIYSRTTAGRHDVIPAGIAALEKMAPSGNFTVEKTENPEAFTDANLQKFAVIVFMNTTGDILDETGKAVFQKFVESGGGFVGVHAATDTEHNWPWYGRTIGAYFINHPRIQPAYIDVVDGGHPATAHLPKRWKMVDEWYNFKNVQEDNHVLLNLDETSYEGGKNGKSHPAAWTRTAGKGRVFYTALGHRKEVFSDPDFIIHLRNGILWAAGIKSAAE